MLVTVVVLIPMPNVPRYILGATMVFCLFTFLSTIAKESQEAIVTKFRLKKQKQHLQNDTRVYQATQKLLESAPDTKIEHVVEDVAQEGLRASRVLLFTGDGKGTRLLYGSAGISKELRDHFAEITKALLTNDGSTDKKYHVLSGEDQDAARDGDPDLPVTPSSLILPLVVYQEITGALVLMRSDDHPKFSGEDHQAATLLAAQIATRLANQALSEQILVSERLSAVGQLAAGVAHEINNPLTYILGNQTFIRNLVNGLKTAVGDAHMWQESRETFQEELADVQEALTDVHEGMERVQAIVEELGVFSKDMNATKTKPINACEIMESASKMVEPQLKSRAHLVKHYEAVPLMLGDKGKLTQAFLNVLLNASQAIETGRADQNQIIVHVYSTANARVVIDVDDTGCGIPEAVANRLFLPFVTTKSETKGTGLGLAITQRLVTSMSGQITFERRSPRGTRFRLSFPSTTRNEAPITIDDAPQNDELIAKQRKRILVVDDEDKIRAMISRTLSPQHDVAVAKDGAEALCMLSENTFDVILCDLMMPVLNGVDVHTQFFAEKRGTSETKFVFMTGGVTDHEIANFIKDQRKRGTVVLQKPLQDNDFDALVST